VAAAMDQEVLETPLIQALATKDPSGARGQREESEEEPTAPCLPMPPINSTSLVMEATEDMAAAIKTTPINHFP